MARTRGSFSLFSCFASAPDSHYGRRSWSMSIVCKIRVISGWTLCCLLLLLIAVRSWHRACSNVIVHPLYFSFLTHNCHWPWHRACSDCQCPATLFLFSAYHCHCLPTLFLSSSESFRCHHSYHCHYPPTLFLYSCTHLSFSAHSISLFLIPLSLSTHPISVF